MAKNTPELTVDQRLQARSLALQLAVENPRPALRTGGVIETAEQYFAWLIEDDAPAPKTTAQQPQR